MPATSGAFLSRRESVTVFLGWSLGAPDTAAPARGAVCRTFGLKRITLPTLIDFLAWIGWSAGLRDTGKA